MIINPLDEINQRCLTTLPPHFVSINIDGWNLEEVKLWITQKLTGRYAIANKPVAHENKLVQATVIAFENPKELTYFSLACPYIRRYYD